MEIGKILVVRLLFFVNYGLSKKRELIRMHTKRLIGALGKYITSSDYRFLINANLGLYNKMLDEEYLKRKFRAAMGYELSLKDPKTFSEKLQWLKLYDRKPEYTMMVDKYRVREYVSKTIGEEYLIPLLGMWEDPEDIDFDALPERFVLKCNHNSGQGMCVCKDKSKLNVQKVKKELKKGLRQDYYLTGREWPYKDVKRCVIAEQYMEDSGTVELRDYKFFCFNGEVKMLYIATDRQAVCKETKFDFFDMDFNHLDFTNGHPNATVVPEKPTQFQKMKELAEKLSQGIPHVRVDLYEVDGRIYFGELTFSHWSGMEAFEPMEWDHKIGRWLTLPKCK